MNARTSSESQRRAYWRERWKRAVQSFGIKRDVTIALLSAGVASFLIDSSELWPNILAPLIGALLGVLLYETGYFVWRFTVTVPMAMHFEHLETISQMEKVHRIRSVSYVARKRVHWLRASLVRGLILLSDLEDCWGLVFTSTSTMTARRESIGNLMRARQRMNGRSKQRVSWQGRL